MRKNWAFSGLYKMSKSSTTTQVCRCHETPIPEKRSSQFHKPPMKGLVFPITFSTEREEAGRIFEDK